MPAAFFLLFGRPATATGRDAPAGGNVSAYMMISFAVYGAMIATTSAGASVAVERALGWSPPAAADPAATRSPTWPTKVLTAMVLGAAGGGDRVRRRRARRRRHARLGLAGQRPGRLARRVVFAAFGLFIGYLVPSENVMQLLGPVLALLALMGGIFVPLDELSDDAADAGEVHPGLRRRRAGPGAADRRPGGRSAAVANVVVWTALFAAGAVWRFRRDTAAGLTAVHCSAVTRQRPARRSVPTGPAHRPLGRRGPTRVRDGTSAGSRSARWLSPRSGWSTSPSRSGPRGVHRRHRGRGGRASSRCSSSPSGSLSYFAWMRGAAHPHRGAAASGRSGRCSP